MIHCELARYGAELGDVIDHAADGCGDCLRLLRAQIATFASEGELHGGGSDLEVIKLASELRLIAGATAAAAV